MGTKEKELSVTKMQRSIDDHIGLISERHRMHRKIKFLLDVRGLVIINKMGGDYVEFGVYRGEMMYSAARVLSPHIERFIGLDTFTGLPEPQQEDDRLFVFESWGFMASPKTVACGMMDEYNTVLIEGDFRQKKTQTAFTDTKPTISVMTIDCNWPSSVEAAFDMSASFLKSGSIIFIDDYFVATSSPNFNDPILKKAAEEKGLRLVDFMTYPPSARAFLVEQCETGQ